MPSWPTRALLVTSTDDLITWARGGSLMWMTFGLACCAVEIDARCRCRAMMPSVSASRRVRGPRQSGNFSLWISSSAWHAGTNKDGPPAFHARSTTTRCRSRVNVHFPMGASLRPMADGFITIIPIRWVRGLRPASCLSMSMCPAVRPRRRLAGSSASPPPSLPAFCKRRIRPHRHDRALRSP